MSTTPKVPPTPGADRLPVTLPALAEKKRLGEPLVMVTAYDFPSAQVAEAAGVDLVLVGDSGQQLTGELSDLLRRRLRIANLIFLCSCAVFLVRNLLVGGAFTIGRDDYEGISRTDNVYIAGLTAR